MKNLLFLICCFIFTSNVKAQEDNKVLNFGLKAGLNSATFSGEYARNNDIGSREGLYAGVFLNYKFSKRFSFQPELLYSMQGASDAKVINGVRVDYVADYVNIPLVVRYYATKYFSLHIGPQLGFNVNDKITVKGNGEEQTETLKVNPFDFGLNSGLGYEFKSGLGIDARYSFGLFEVIDGYDSKNGVFSIGLSYKF